MGLRLGGALPLRSSLFHVQKGDILIFFREVSKKNLQKCKVQVYYCFEC